MSQKSRPAADVFNSGWSPSVKYFRRINEEIPDSSPGSVVTSANDPAGNIFEVKLSNLAWPQDGASKLTVELQKTDVGSVPVTILLVQGSTVIASKSVTPGTTFDKYFLNLPEDQINPITDYTDLRVRVIAGSLTVSCCPVNVPPVLYASFPGATLGCTCLGPIQIVYDQATGRWKGSKAICGTVVTVQMRCGATESNFLAIASCPGSLAVEKEGSGTCSPLNVVFPYPFPIDCCLGSGTAANLLVTE